MHSNAFLDMLPTDELLPWEHGMRKALMKAIDACGPLPLIDWIDRRIGGEVESIRSAAGIEVRLRGDAGPARLPPPVAAAPPVPVHNEAFLNSLPADSFSTQEEDLRDSIFEFLASWTLPSLATLEHLHGFPTFQQCARAFLPRSVPIRAWIERRIGGEIEIRLGPRGEEVIHVTKVAEAAVKEKFERMQKGGMPKGAGKGKEPFGKGKEPPAGKAAGKGKEPYGKGKEPPAGKGKEALVGKGKEPSAGKGKEGKGRGGAAPKGGPAAPAAPATAAQKEAFFATLPADELLDSEVELRQALLNFMEQWEKGGAPPTMADTGADPEINRWRKEVLPPKAGARMADWIERRIGGEIELRAAKNGQFEIYLRGEAPMPEAEPEEPVQAASSKEEFFERLPTDEFSEAEENLRAALIAFIESCPSVPLLAEAGSEAEVARWKKEVIPKGCPATLKDWIDRRIGGELETRAGGANGAVQVGLRGKFGGKRQRR